MMRTDWTGTGEKGRQNPPCICRRNTLPGTTLLRASTHTGVPKKAFPKQQADGRYEKAEKKTVLAIHESQHTHWDSAGIRMSS